MHGTTILLFHGISWDNDHFNPDIEYSLELWRRHSPGYRVVAQLPEWFRAWPDERRDRVDEALETRLDLQRYTSPGEEGEDIIEFELE
jgi:hypothetical protein